MINIKHLYEKSLTLKKCKPYLGCDKNCSKPRKNILINRVIRNEKKIDKNPTATSDGVH